MLLEALLNDSPVKGKDIVLVEPQCRILIQQTTDSLSNLCPSTYWPLV